MIKEILLYLLSYYSLNVREWLGGRKKIQKLMFLVDYDIEGKVRKLGFSGAEYRILVYGPYSDEITNAVEELIEEGRVEEIVVSDSFSPRSLVNRFEEELSYENGRLYLYRPIGDVPRLNTKARLRVEYVVDRYGRLSGSRLEVFIAKRLGLTPEIKEKYFGMPIDEYLKNVLKQLY